MINSGLCTFIPTSSSFLQSLFSHNINYFLRKLLPPCRPFRGGRRCPPRPSLRSGRYDLAAVFHLLARAAAAGVRSDRPSSRVAPRVRPLPVGLSPSVAGSRSSPTVCGVRLRGGGGRSASPRRSIFRVLGCLGASLRAPLLPRCPLLLRRRRLLGTRRVALALWVCALRLGSAVNGRLGSPRPAACGSVRGSYGAGVRGWRYAPAAKGLTLRCLRSRRGFGSACTPFGFCLDELRSYGRT